MLYLGVDVGGTHTDAVAVEYNGSGESKVLSSAKVSTSSDLVYSLKDVLDSLFKSMGKSPKTLPIKRVVVSSTIVTNILAQGLFDKTHLFLIPGSGISPDVTLFNNEHPLVSTVNILSGSIDHRGVEMAPLDPTELDSLNQLVFDLLEKRKNCAVVGKFSTRNKAHEDIVGHALKGMDNISFGHSVSGRLNFPRRVNTTLFNSSLMYSNHEFISKLLGALDVMGLSQKTLFLKADGGTMSVASALSSPINSIASGPAASMLGALAILHSHKEKQDIIPNKSMSIQPSNSDDTLISNKKATLPMNKVSSVSKGRLKKNNLSALSLINNSSLESAGDDNQFLVIDIGGSTTDLGLIMHASPLTEREGMSIFNKKTLVPGLFTRSIALGGDSPILIKEASKFTDDIQLDKEVDGDRILGFEIGQMRLGPSLSLGGNYPTLTDALNLLGLSAFGDVDKSCLGMSNLAKKLCLNVEFLAKEAVRLSMDKIKRAYEAFIREGNETPVYTINQLLHGDRVNPNKAILIGGPARAIKDAISSCLGLECLVLEMSNVANALGAALARTTHEVSFYADTYLGKAEALGFSKKIGNSYSLKNAEADALALLREQVGLLNDGGSDSLGKFEIYESESFNMVGDYGLVGRQYRIRCGVRPELIAYPNLVNSQD